MKFAGWILVCSLGTGAAALVLGCGGDDEENPGASSGGTGGSGAAGGTGATGGSGGSAGSAAGGSAGGGTGGTSSCTMQVPDTYDGSAWDANVAVEVDVVARFKALLQPMKDAELSTASKPTAAELQALFAAGSPSLKSLTSAYYAPKIEAWFSDFEAAAGNSWKPAEPPSGSGGIWEKWIFDERGTDLRQSIEKGMFGASHYAHAVSLAAGSPDAKAIDRMLAIYGAHPSFPHDDKAATNPDQLTAQYAKRRDDKTSATPGFYRKLKSSFITARTAAAVGADCAAERDAAIASILGDWERVLFATVIYYSNDAIKKLSVDPPTEADSAAGLHGLGEATAFVHGFRQLSGAPRKITEAELDELLVLLNAPATGAANTYKFVTDAAGELSKLQQVIAKVKAVYGFSDAEVESFKINY